jgi:hypothetical protein
MIAMHELRLSKFAISGNRERNSALRHLASQTIFGNASHALNASKTRP